MIEIISCLMAGLLPLVISALILCLPGKSRSDLQVSYKEMAHNSESVDLLELKQDIEVSRV